MAPKGKSREEKKALILNAMHEARAPFDKRGLEKIHKDLKVCTNEKDPLEIVKDLMTDGLVESEKIGALVIFWALKSTMVSKISNDLQRCKESIINLRADKERLKTLLIESKLGKQDSETRRHKLQLLEKLKAAYKKKEADLQKFRKNDPERYQEIESEIEDVKAKINRFTDGFYQIKKYLRKNMFYKTNEEYLQFFELEDEKDLEPEYIT